MYGREVYKCRARDTCVYFKLLFLAFHLNGKVVPHALISTMQCRVSDTRGKTPRTFLLLALDGGTWSPSFSGRWDLRNIPVLIDRRLRGTRNSCLGPRLFQPIACLLYLIKIKKFHVFKAISHLFSLCMVLEQVMFQWRQDSILSRSGLEPVLP